MRERIRGLIEGILNPNSMPRWGGIGTNSQTPPTPMRAGPPAGVAGYRHGHRERRLLGTFGAVDIRVARARLAAADGETTEWPKRST